MTVLERAVAAAASAVEANPEGSALARGCANGNRGSGCFTAQAERIGGDICRDSPSRRHVEQAVALGITTA